MHWESKMKLVVNRSKRTQDEKFDYTDKTTGEKFVAYKKAEMLLSDYEMIMRAEAVTDFVEWIISNNELPNVISEALRKLADDFIE